MIVCIVIIAICLIGCVIWWCFDSNNASPVILSIMASAMLGCLVADLTKKKSPTALDVYRGKTTLEITYRDSVAVDSVVVYKMK